MGITMEITKGFSVSDAREVTTQGGVFFSLIPHLYKGERGCQIMAEKAIMEKINAGEPVMVREKSNEKGKYIVVRTSRDNEDKYFLFTLSSGGSQDHRYSYGQFKINSITDGIVLCDISGWWGDQHKAIIALKAGGFAEIEGNHGAGFKSKNPQPNFLIHLKSDGSQESTTNLDLDLDECRVEQFDQLVSEKKEVRWASWAGQKAYFSLPIAKKIMADLKTSRQIVLQAIICGQETMAKDGSITAPLGNSRIDLNSMVNFYRPAPVDLYNYSSNVELYNPQNFFVNFCVGVEGSENMIHQGLSLVGPSNGFGVIVMKPIKGGRLILVGGVSLAEIIGNNLFIYVDLLSGNPSNNSNLLGQLLPLIVEEVNKIFTEKLKS